MYVLCKYYVSKKSYSFFRQLYLGSTNESKSDTLINFVRGRKILSIKDTLYK